MCAREENRQGSWQTVAEREGWDGRAAAEGKPTATRPRTVASRAPEALVSRTSGNTSSASQIAALEKARAREGERWRGRRPGCSTACSARTVVPNLKLQTGLVSWPRSGADGQAVDRPSDDRHAADLRGPALRPHLAWRAGRAAGVRDATASARREYSEGRADLLVLSDMQGIAKYLRVGGVPGGWYSSPCRAGCSADGRLWSHLSKPWRGILFRACMRFCVLTACHVEGPPVLWDAKALPCRPSFLVPLLQLKMGFLPRQSAMIMGFLNSTCGVCVDFGRSRGEEVRSRGGVTSGRSTRERVGGR